MKRRTFLKMAGWGSVAFAAGCSSEPQKTLYALVKNPDDMVTGQAHWYAGTCRECPAGCGVIAKNREGRIIKLEGNPLHPLNRGRLCMRGQAALQGLYNPDRLKTPLLKTKTGFKEISFSRAVGLLSGKIAEARSLGPNRVAMMTETIGDTLYGLFKKATDQLSSGPPLVFETYGYDHLKNASARILGSSALPAIQMDQSDCLIAFGADFLETWLSPVELARKFMARKYKKMHGLGANETGCFYFVSPFQSLTGANADAWLMCKPGSETAVVLGLVNTALQNGRGRELPADIYRALKAVVHDLSPDEVTRISGIDASHFKSMGARMLAAKQPLVLGAGHGIGDLNGLQTEMAVVWLNLVLDPELTLFDFDNRHRVETAAGRKDIRNFFAALDPDGPDVGLRLVLLNNINPVYSLPSDFGVAKALLNPRTFVVCFSNFMDETARLSDLIVPTRMPLESWDAYAGQGNWLSLLQPATGQVVKRPHLGDLILKIAFDADAPAENYKTYLMAQLKKDGWIKTEQDWLAALGRGGVFDKPVEKEFKPVFNTDLAFFETMTQMRAVKTYKTVFTAAPSIRFFDGRGANIPWLNEIPDTLTQAAWQAPVCAHPKTLAQKQIQTGDEVRLTSRWGAINAVAYASRNICPGVWAMAAGQGHKRFGRYADGVGANPFEILPAADDAALGKGFFSFKGIHIIRTGRKKSLALTSGSRVSHGRKIALTVPMGEIASGLKFAKNEQGPKAGLTMDSFPLTLPTAEGYDPKRDFYPPHEHDRYRWAMVVDLDRCIGCSACVAACYAENNIGVSGPKQVAKGREMAWLQIQCYQEGEDNRRQVFLPMMCQHCDNAPCESVCPVYAPHHSKEGINNQIYNRCIGTRFCAQNCPYKVRRFNWLTWQWPEPLNLQLNPNVTVRAKGVMEKCSFCIQRIKAAHDKAKNENRDIADGEVVPACMQTCPTEAIAFGNLMDKNSRVYRLATGPRAYQVMGYLNTKTAVIYLKKIVRNI